MTFVVTAPPSGQKAILFPTYLPFETCSCCDFWKEERDEGKEGEEEQSWPVE